MHEQGAPPTKADFVTAFADLRASILRWLVATPLALGGFIFAAIEFTR